MRGSFPDLSIFMVLLESQPNLENFGVRRTTLETKVHSPQDRIYEAPRGLPFSSLFLGFVPCPLSSERHNIQRLRQNGSSGGNAFFT